MNKILDITACCLIVWLLYMLPTNSQAGSWYFEMGVGVNKLDWSYPEVDLQSPLGRLAIAYEGDYGWVVEASHTSSIPGQERGHGLNAVWLLKRVYLK